MEDKNITNNIMQYYNLNANNITKIEDISFPEHSFIILASARRTGKSCLIHNILNVYLQQHDIDSLIVFTNTKFNEEFYYIPKENIFEYSDCEEKLEKIIDSQKNKLNKKIYCPHLIIILDDINLSQRNDSIINSSSYGRHVKVTIILSVQYPKSVCDTKIRANFDILMYNELNETALKAIHESFHMPFSYQNLKEFTNYILDNTDHTFICYNKSNKRKERLKLVKAELYKDIKLNRNKIINKKNIILK